MIFNVQVTVDGQNGGSQASSFGASGSATRAGRVSYSGGVGAPGAGALAAAAAAAGTGQAAHGEQPEPAVVEQRVLDAEHQVGRNDPCWCGSGKKYKRCHGA
jgi:preprotein translocase subunit SecA